MTVLAAAAPRICAVKYQAAYVAERCNDPIESSAASAIAGFAYDDDGVATIAAASHAPTAKGPDSTRPLRAHPKSTIINAIESMNSL